MPADLTPDVIAYLEDICIPLRLACTTESGWPMVLSLWYIYQDGRLYCATRQTARVVSYLQADARCAFEVAADEPPYCGVRGQAIATLDEARGPETLSLLIERYLGGSDNELAQMLLKHQEEEVALVLEPRTLFTWNFTQRMAQVSPAEPQKPCPQG